MTTQQPISEPPLKQLPKLKIITTQEESTFKVGDPLFNSEIEQLAFQLGIDLINERDKYGWLLNQVFYFFIFDEKIKRKMKILYLYLDI